MRKKIDHTVCSWCGKELPEPDPRRRPGHSQCAAAAMVQHNTEVHYRAGPGYEKWRKGMLAYARRLSGEKD